MPEPRKKLIEVALPLDAINQACAADKNVKTGHIRNLHKWFAPMPLPAWRALLFASLVDDPGNDLPFEEAEREREALFFIIKDMIREGTRLNWSTIKTAREKIKDNFPNQTPLIVDPFCGGGSTIVEAQRLGLKTFASDLNPIPALITTLLTRVPQLFSTQIPINPIDKKNSLNDVFGVGNIFADVRYYARRVREIAFEKVGHLHPEIEFSSGNKRNSLVQSYIWARTVRSPNPIYSDIYVPLVRSFNLSKRTDAIAWIDVVKDPKSSGYSFEVRCSGEPQVKGTTGRAGATCVMSGEPIPLSYIRAEGKAGRIGLRLMAVQALLEGRRVYLSPPEGLEDRIKEISRPEMESIAIPKEALGFRVREYGFTEFSDLFTNRQLTCLLAFVSAIQQVSNEIERDVQAKFETLDDVPLENGGSGSRAYVDAICLMLGICLGKLTQSNNSLIRWYIDARNGTGQPLPAFDRHAIPMIWDFTEVNPFGGSIGDWDNQVKTALRAFQSIDFDAPPSTVMQLDARDITDVVPAPLVVATDPPYYDNIGYADLSDFFYMWIRFAIRGRFNKALATVSTPKINEIIAARYRHSGSTEAAHEYFQRGMKEVFTKISEKHHASIPMIIIYAYKQKEKISEAGGSTGWESILQALIDAGLAIVGTWPISSNRKTRMIAVETNSLLSSIAMVCRPRDTNAPIATRQNLHRNLRAELPTAIRLLQTSSVAPADLAQASIGPGMAIFSRYAKVLEADDSVMTVKTALQLINQALDEYLSEQEAEYDADTRFAITWLEAHGMETGPYGTAETLATARGVAVAGVVEAGILEARGGNVRLLRRDEMPDDWDPAIDKRLCVWECSQHLIRVLENEGESAAAGLLARLGARGEVARDLAYRLYGICERKQWAEEARAYNGLVVAWLELTRLAARAGPTGPAQSEMAI